jgi:hypothetical protein
MITSIAGLLESLKAKEAAILAEEGVTHAPTIGDMYEGLTKKLLARAIPKDLGLKLVDGFVLGVDGKHSNQVDAMLVMGDKGRLLPNTTKWEWPIQDVLAVFEVKKNLYANELVDSINKMRVISQQQQAYLLATKQNFPIDASRNAFARVMGRYPEKGEMEDFVNPGGEILRTIAHEQLAPVRVVFGYDGYANEHGLREAFLDYLETQKDGGVAGPAVLPNLIVCRTNSLLKLTGHPYTSRLDENGRWGLVASERHAPFRLLIELLWTRLSNQFQKEFPMDDSLTEEGLARLLDGRPVVVGEQRGWELHSTTISKKNLEEIEPHQWAPVELSIDELKIVLMAMNHGGLGLEDAGLLEAAGAYGIDLGEFADKLVSDRLFAWISPTMAEPIGEQIHQVIAPTGHIWVSTNGALLNLWVMEQSMKNDSDDASA